MRQSVRYAARAAARAGPGRVGSGRAGPGGLLGAYLAVTTGFSGPSPKSARSSSRKATRVTLMRLETAKKKPMPRTFHSSVRRMTSMSSKPASW